MNSVNDVLLTPPPNINITQALNPSVVCAQQQMTDQTSVFLSLKDSLGMNSPIKWFLFVINRLKTHFLAIDEPTWAAKNSMTRMQARKEKETQKI